MYLEHDRPTVFLVDADPAVRRSVRPLAEPRRLAVEPYDSAAEFLRAVAPSDTGCVLADAGPDGCAGLDLPGRMVEQGVYLPVVLMGPPSDAATVVRAIKAGAIDYLQKPCTDPVRWAEAIEEAVRWDAENRPRLVFHARIHRRLGRLSPGERDVLDLLVAGRTNREIAGRLGVTERAIEARRAKVMQKMRAASLAELVRLAVEASK